MLTLNNENGQQLNSNHYEIQEPSPFSEESENEEFKASNSDIEQEDAVEVKEKNDNSIDSGDEKSNESMKMVTETVESLTPITRQTSSDHTPT